jgi:SSS family solute:Na+ symporter
MKGELNWDSPDQAFASLLMNKMPTGLRGLVAAGLLAALMSSLASVFNSCSTLFTVDIYKKLRPHESEEKLLSVGRRATAVVVLMGIAWIPIMQNISGVLYEYLQSVQSYIAPPITAVFLLGIFFKRINSQGAIATLLTGLFLAITRLVVELNKANLEPGSILHQFGTMNFLTFACWFFLFCVVLCVVVSLLTPAPSPEKIKGLTYGTLTEEQKAANRTSYNAWDIALTMVVLAIIVWLMFSFTG